MLSGSRMDVRKSATESALSLLKMYRRNVCSVKNPYRKDILH